MNFARSDTSSATASAMSSGGRCDLAMRRRRMRADNGSTGATLRCLLCRFGYGTTNDRTTSPRLHAPEGGLDRVADRRAQADAGELHIRRARVSAAVYRNPPVDSSTLASIPLARNNRTTTSALQSSSCTRPMFWCSSFVTSAIRPGRFRDKSRSYRYVKYSTNMRSHQHCRIES